MSDTFENPTKQKVYEAFIKHLGVSSGTEEMDEVREEAEVLVNTAFRIINEDAAAALSVDSERHADPGYQRDVLKSLNEFFPFGAMPMQIDTRAKFWRLTSPHARLAGRVVGVMIQVASGEALQLGRIERIKEAFDYIRSWHSTNGGCLIVISDKPATTMLQERLDEMGVIFRHIATPSSVGPILKTILDPMPHNSR